MRFVIRRSVNDQFYWEIVAANNQVLAVSETYVAKASALNAIGVVKAGAASARVDDETVVRKQRSLP